jgi:homoserine dehydrogenase
VLSDISALTYDYRYEYKKLHQPHDLKFSNTISIEAFVSFDLGTHITISDFEEFQSGYAANGKQYMVGKVGLEKLNSWSRIDGVGIILAPKAKLIPQKEIAPLKELAVA